MGAKVLFKLIFIGLSNILNLLESLSFTLFFRS